MPENKKQARPRRAGLCGSGLYPGFCSLPAGKPETIYLLRPTWRCAFARTGSPCAGLALLPRGLALPPALRRGAVRSYRTFSPLPAVSRRLYVFCCAFHAQGILPRNPGLCLSAGPKARRERFCRPHALCSPEVPPVRKSGRAASRPLSKSLKLQNHAFKAQPCGTFRTYSKCIRLMQKPCCPRCN